MKTGNGLTYTTMILNPVFQIALYNILWNVGAVQEETISGESNVLFSLTPFKLQKYANFLTFNSAVSLTRFRQLYAYRWTVDNCRFHDGIPKRKLDNG